MQTKCFFRSVYVTCTFCTSAIFIFCFFNARIYIYLVLSGNIWEFQATNLLSMRDIPAPLLFSSQDNSFSRYWCQKRANQSICVFATLCSSPSLFCFSFSLLRDSPVASVVTYEITRLATECRFRNNRDKMSGRKLRVNADLTSPLILFSYILPKKRG